ncbi:MAG: chorismate synthase [Oscillospiraceae bacterium]|nr:chorismate synthase [Oscillospiraceae bacterium]
MSSIIGQTLKISIFGQSHAAGIGVVIDGFPAGITVDMEKLGQFLARRAPGGDRFSTPRTEEDRPEFLSGIVDGVTCGAPICAVIRNEDTRSVDYRELKDIPRPAHADFTAQMRYGGYQDVRGGGHFSGRLTAPLCIAGGLCMQLLEQKGIAVGAHIYSIGSLQDTPFDPVTVSEKDFPRTRFAVIDPVISEKMQELISDVRTQGDSIGGIVECAVVGMPGGIGDPMFDGIENRLAAILFGIPAVKGLEFGSGFAAARMRGSENNDPFCIQDGAICTQTNHHGGILGGISSGMPILFRVAFKPTPTIALPQQSVSLSKMEEVELKARGRHDPCVVPRATVCVEAAAAIAVCDMIL